MAKFATRFEKLREKQTRSRRGTGVRNYQRGRRRVAGDLPLRSRARSSSIRATSSRRPTRTRAWAAPSGASRGRRLDRVRGAATGGFTPLVVPESIASSSPGRLRPARRREGRDAPHPRDVREARGDVNRVMEFGGSRACSRCARRARHAREHGDRVPARGAVIGGRRDDARVDRGAAAGVDDRALRAKVVTPDPRRDYAGGMPDRSRRRSCRWSRRRAIRSRRREHRRTARVRRSASVKHRDRVRRLVHRRQARTTSTCTRA